MHNMYFLKTFLLLQTMSSNHLDDQRNVMASFEESDSIEESSMLVIIVYFLALFELLIKETLFADSRKELTKFSEELLPFSVMTHLHCNCFMIYHVVKRYFFNLHFVLFLSRDVHLSAPNGIYNDAV
jgi:hypothetical protein